MYARVTATETRHLDDKSSRRESKLGMIDRISLGSKAVLTENCLLETAMDGVEVILV